MWEKDNACKVEISKKGLEIRGRCAQGLLEVFHRSFNDSEKLNFEIFGCACVNPKTGETEKVIIRNSGSPTSVNTKGFGRVCSKDTFQLSYHTHPVSGKAKFSEKDGIVIVDRFNREYDDGHCVVGDSGHRCVFQTKLKRNEEISGN